MKSQDEIPIVILSLHACMIFIGDNKAMFGIKEIYFAFLFVLLFHEIVKCAEFEVLAIVF